jgi:hypothetical protein
MSYVSDVAYTILFPDVAQYRMFIAEAHALTNQPMHADDADEKRIHVSHPNRRTVWGDMVSGLAETQHGETLFPGDLLDAYNQGRRQAIMYPCISFYQKGVRWFNGVYGTAPPDHEDLLYLAQQRSKVHYKEVSIDLGGEVLPLRNLSLCAYKFIRLGEDAQDTEIRTGGSHYISVHNLMAVERRINLNNGVKRVLSSIGCVV